jgi:probable rRNA maturation factor
MSYKIFIHSDEEFAHATDVLETACRVTLAHEDAVPGDLSIVLVGEDRMRQFNLQFADADRPTDVLAFTDGSVDPDSDTTYHGDIIICAPMAAMQAARSGNSLSDELSLLAVHGVLHLLGYDHDTEETRAAMWDVQTAILQQLGCSISLPEES